ncbi:hypothetical protein DV738_g4034, partial [Chaetothyriales sp. CBS 135597]
MHAGAHSDQGREFKQPDANASPEEASFAALVAFLQKSIPSQDSVKIAEDLIEPFKHACHLTDASLLEPLLVLFQDCEEGRSVLSLESRDPEDYVSRFLVADLVRELCAHGAAVEDFFAEETATQTLLSFPKAPKCDANWLSQLQEFFSDQDATIAFLGTRQFATRIYACQMELEQGLETLQAGVLIISEQFAVLLPSLAGIQTLTLPIYASDLMEVAYSSNNASILEIRYLHGSGYKQMKGERCGLSKFSFRFALEDHAVGAMDCVVDAQKSANKASQGCQTPRHRSIAWCQLVDTDGACQTLVTTEESPLQNLSQNHSVDVASGETTSESSFRGSQRDESGFADKLVAARDTPGHGTKMLRFTKVVDKVVEKSRYKSKGGGDLSSRDVEEGASEAGGPRLPPELQLWHFNRATSSPSQVSKPAARLEQEDEIVTIATTRQRRACTTKTYDESAELTIPETSSEPNEGVGKHAASPRSVQHRDEDTKDKNSKSNVGTEEDEEPVHLSHPAAGGYQPPMPKAARVSFGARLSAMFPSGPVDKENIQPVQTPPGRKRGLVSQSNASRGSSPRKRTPAATKTMTKVAANTSNQSSGLGRRLVRRLGDSSSTGYDMVEKAGIVHLRSEGPAKQGELGSTKPHLSEGVQRDLEDVKGKEHRASAGHDAGSEDEGLMHIDDDLSPVANETDTWVDGIDQAGGGRQSNDDQADHKRQTGGKASDGGKYKDSSLAAAGQKGAKAERVKPRRMGVESEFAEPIDQAHSSSTPVPFHIVLERDLRLGQGGEYHSEEERTDPTLVERHETGDGPILLRSESSEDMYMTQTRPVTDGSEDGDGDEEDSEAESTDAGNQHALRQRLRGIFERMIEDSLLCLSKEQHTIEQKVDWFAAAGQAAIEEMQAVWVSKIQHERRKMDSQLQEEEKKLRAAVAAAASITDNDWTSTLLKTQQITHAVQAREEAITARLEEVQQQLGRC